MSFSQKLLDNFRGRLTVPLLHPCGVYSRGFVLVNIISYKEIYTAILLYSNINIATSKCTVGCYLFRPSN